MNNDFSHTLPNKRLPSGNLLLLLVLFSTQFSLNARQTGIQSQLTLNVSGLPADSREIVWDRLPLLKGERIDVYKGIENVSSFCHHPTIYFYKDRFFASWSNGDRDEDSSMQRVLYATSTDGRNWSTAQNLTGSIPEKAYTPCGYWLRNGEFFALASLSDSRASQLKSNDNRKLLAYRWNANTLRFEYYGIFANGFYAINGPELTADGEWLMFGKPGDELEKVNPTIYVARGGTNAPDRWEMKPLPDNEVSHDISSYTLADGRLLAIEAKKRVPNRRLASLVSSDKGKTWTAPRLSNFPDGDSRLYSLKLSNGIYVLLNNPSLTRYRIPLAIALSADGMNYDHIANIRIEQTNKKYSGHAKAPGYQYMRAMEHDGKLWIIYSINKEDVEITVVSLKEIEQFYNRVQTYDNRQPAVELIVDNTGKGFSTLGEWSIDTSAGIYDGVWTGYYGSNYSVMRKNLPREQAWAQWKPEIKEAGLYSVYIKWASVGFGTRSPMTDRAPIEITHAKNTKTTSVDQTRYGGSWVFLGTYNLKKGEDFHVKMFTGETGRTVADAIKLVKMRK